MKNTEGITIKGKYLFFWHGIFSNWHSCEFSINEIVFNSSEQAMMFKKATLFNDTDSSMKILHSSSPKVAKALGRKVNNFNPKTWDKHKEDIVYKILLEKFSQNEDLKQDLLSTDDLILVEASPYDKIWGIGMGTDDPNITNPSKWKGENLLGKVLMRVRDSLKNIYSTKT